MKLTKNSASALILAGLLMAGCHKKSTPTASTEATNQNTAVMAKEQPAQTITAAQLNAAKPVDNFEYIADQFADLRVLRYQVPGFEALPAQQKEMLYYLYEAALCGRDIIYDQNYKNNLRIRRTLDAIVENYSGDRNSPEFQKFITYTKRVWFSNGIHHHYSSNKIQPEFTQVYFAELVKNSPNAKFPLNTNETKDQFVKWISPILFDPKIAPKKVNQAAGQDLIASSSTNFYEGVTQKEVEEYYAKKEKKDDPQPISYGLNSKLVKEGGVIKEKTWKVGGMYDASISKIVYWLEKALPLAEDPKQKESLAKLIQFYKTGDLKTWDDYNIAWVSDVTSPVDVVNGFIEVYGDPLGMRASYESVVSFKDMEATKRIKAIGDQAQWFEDNSTLMPQHKKKNVKGITAKVITVVVEAGDAAPTTPIGINLPNANWIRKEHGSKSVNLGNVVYSYNQAATKGSALSEFAYSQEEVDRAKKYGGLAGDLHTDMHEVIGHASGQINPGVGTPKQTLKSYASSIEEGRADLVALYYVMDPKLVEIGVMPSLEVGKTEYDGYIRGGMMTQLSRLAPGEDVEEAHMRNRQMISKWAYEMGKKDNVIEKKVRDGKTYYVINDYNRLRAIFGEQLRELQRITSEGDYNAAMKLIETYGVKVDPELHKEVLARYAKLNIPPYSGFIQPKLVPVMQNGKVIDVKVEYPSDFTKQMLEFGKQYNYLPNVN